MTKTSATTTRTKNKKQSKVTKRAARRRRRRAPEEAATDLEITTIPGEEGATASGANHYKLIHENRI